MLPDLLEFGKVSRPPLAWDRSETFAQQRSHQRTWQSYITATPTSTASELAMGGVAEWFD
jgi:hypothetical protein